MTSTDPVKSRTTNSHVGPKLSAWRRRTDGPLLVLAIGSLPLLLLDLKSARFAYHDRVFLNVVNIIVLIAFAIDYLVEFCVAEVRSQYLRREWTSALIVAAQAIALIPALAGVGALRVFRAGRLLRPTVVVARVFAIGGAGAQEGREILRRHAARFALALAGFSWLLHR